jgi:hypothetical protein
LPRRRHIRGGTLCSDAGKALAIAEFEVRGLGVLGALLALFVLDSHVAGASECQSGFEKWSKLSQARVRTQGTTQAAGGKANTQACAPGDAVRQELLKALARVRAKCDEVPSDPLVPATKTMIDINDGFIRNLPVCIGEEAVAVAAPPKAAPTPSPPPPPAAPPRATPAAAATAVPPPASTPPDGKRCLSVSRVAQERYTLSNRWCGGSTVLAIVETRAASGEVECRAHAIGQSMAVRSHGNSPPQVNHECLWSQGNCTKEHLDGMFPECDW